MYVCRVSSFTCSIIEKTLLTDVKPVNSQGGREPACPVVYIVLTELFTCCMTKHNTRAPYIYTEATMVKVTKGSPNLLYYVDYISSLIADHYVDLYLEPSQNKLL